MNMSERPRMTVGRPRGIDGCLRILAERQRCKRQNSGLFGIYGRFYDKLLGNFHMYGTKAHGSVVITMKHDETVVLTPNEREEFATELKRRLNLGSNCEGGR